MPLAVRQHTARLGAQNISRNRLLQHPDAMLPKRPDGIEAAADQQDRRSYRGGIDTDIDPRSAAGHQHIHHREPKYSRCQQVRSRSCGECTNHPGKGGSQQSSQNLGDKRVIVDNNNRFRSIARHAVK
nr:hypothetical protein [uncultured Rhodopila sp.]